MTAFDTKAPLLPEILALHGKWKKSKTALLYKNEMLTWQELNDASNRIANALIAAGVSQGDMVGIVMKNGRQMVEAIIGIMKSGAASVPINLSVADSALEAMMQDADVKLVFASDMHAGRLRTFLSKNPKTRLITTTDRCDDEFEMFKAGGSPLNPDIRIEDQDPLNVIYSSGTTGLPKGILHTHRGRRDWAYDLAVALRYDTSARTLFNLGLYSNISWVGLLATLLAGGTVIIQDTFDPELTLKTIEQQRITNASMVPIQYQRLMECTNQQAFDLSSIKAVMSCGSPLHTELKKQLFDRLGPVVIELFGLTEGVITTLDPEEAEGRMASVGKPLIGTDIKIIGDDNKEMPAGASGEIVANGRIVMPGYLNRTDATLAATYIDDTGSAWIRTGDIGKLDGDGYLYIVDRKKDMILSGGQNIYPQDLEAVIITHSGVNDVAVIGAKSKTWGETPIAIIVGEPEASIDVDQLRTWVNRRLGKQQRITAVILSQTLPRNANGKILKRELRERYEGLSFD